jgi:gliding motility-associated-like protein
VHPKPILQYTAINPTCNGFLDGQINLNTSNGKPNYTYFLDNIPISSNTASGLPAGNFQFQVFDINGCSDSTDIQLIDPPSVTAKIIASPYTIKNQKAFVESTVSPMGNYTYSWEPKSQFDNPSNSNSLYSADKTSTIFLTVKNANGCMSKDSLEIAAIAALHLLMPNTFTPNGDELNDVFQPPSLFEIISLDVYNKWGQVIYQEINKNKGWDGLINGQKSDPGTYSYYIKLKLKTSNQEFNISGKVNLLD